MTQISLEIFKKTKMYRAVQWIIVCALAGILVIMFIPEIVKSKSYLHIIGGIFLSSFFSAFFFKHFTKLGCVVLLDHGLEIRQKENAIVCKKFSEISNMKIKIVSYIGRPITPIGWVPDDGRGNELEFKCNGKKYHFWFQIDSSDQLHRLLRSLDIWTSIEGNNCKVYKPFFMPWNP